MAQILTALDSVEAMEVLDEESEWPDIVLLDYTLRDESGEEVRMNVCMPVVYVRVLEKGPSLTKQICAGARETGRGYVLVMLFVKDVLRNIEVTVWIMLFVKDVPRNIQVTVYGEPSVAVTVVATPVCVPVTV
eukprot:296913-Chlamydomonas_euryale.AAC.10